MTVKSLFIERSKYGTKSRLTTLGVVIVFTTLVSGLVWGLIAGAFYFSEKRCEKIAAEMQVEHSWSILTSCMIRTDEGWFPLEMYRNNVGN